MSEVISSTGEGGVVVVENVPDGALNEEAEVMNDMDDDESVAAVETSNHKGKSKHPTKTRGRRARRRKPSPRRIGRQTTAAAV